MTKLNKYLQEIEERLNAATPGPWFSDGVAYVTNHNHMIVDDVDDEYLKIRARGTGSGLTTDQQVANLELIAHGRQDLEVLRKMVKLLFKRIKYVSLDGTDAVDTISFELMRELESLIPESEGELWTN